MASILKTYLEQSINELIETFKKENVLDVDTVVLRPLKGGVSPEYAMQFHRGIASPVIFQLDILFSNGIISVCPQYLDMGYEHLTLDQWAIIMIKLTEYENNLNNNWHRKINIDQSDELE